MQCPQCDTALRLEVDPIADLHLIKPTRLRRFQIIDLLGCVTIVAIHLAAFPVAASGAEWPGLLVFSPTVITCLVHLRLRLTTSMAMLLHYAVSIIWAYLHSLGQSAAINTHNTSNTSSGRDYQLDLYANAWNDALWMAGFGIIFAVVYGVICYTAINANRPAHAVQPQELLTKNG
jgi:hypothetical protein